MSDLNPSPYMSKSPGDLVKALCADAKPDTQRHEEIKGALAAVLTKSLTNSIDRHEQAATRLALQLLWLNVIFGAFTVAGTVLALVALFK